ncbi:MAG: Alpha-N-arabinofuranosidase [Candidatus Saccharicenans subterraneus]|uniref:non-reducing end alpha-L-arabinofuranosidase n=1 Tax=Candidatus Saccharicenans subterraneus TaxID=2508984 RepID=A0A3E2BPQ5_9BACT|nr:MAG: Alpha-N-arabinofuranosidase [Candidatus Saccharicenans subterraneum]
MRISRNFNKDGKIRLSSHGFLRLLRPGRSVAMLILIIALAWPGAFADQGQQLLPNPSFEETKDGKPVGWRPATYQREAAFEMDKIARTGSWSLKISSEKGADAAWSTHVRVLPFARYRFSGWVRTENIKSQGWKGVLFNVHGLEKFQTRALTGSNDWTRLEMIIETELNDALQINCLFGGWGKVTGQAWFDDLSLELLSARKLRPRATVNPARKLEPISPYLYGQFIEHLGRCIYQGIWAEMLEDRKFYQAVGTPGSPWKIAGEPHSVHMNPLLIYAGVPVPEVRLKGNGREAGIYQESLALQKGRKYTGRLVLAGDPGVLPLEVRLVWGEGRDEREVVRIDRIGPDYEKFYFDFTSGADTENGRLEIVSRGSEAFRVAAVSLMPADNLEGFRPEVIKILKELNSPVYRWPGGNFVSGYDWRDGIGDPDRRPPRKNPAWQGIEHNDVGIHEFMAFCRLVGAEPYIAVNSGQGNETMAADEVEYVNGSADTPMGRLRAWNGHPEPFNCRFWSIGNEMYGDWQLGHMPLADYVRKHNRLAEAMKARDPNIKLIAVGAVGDWSRGMLEACADHMDYISEHFYVGERPGLLSHVYQVPRAIRRIAEAHRQYRKTIPQLKGRDIRIALDEWNYWYGPYVYGELGTQYFLKDALGIAAGLHEYYRQADIIYMANYAQTVNVIGAIKTSKTEAVFDTTGLVLKLYRQEFGTVPVKVSGQPEPLDVMAAWKEDGKTLTVAVVNPTAEKQTLALDLAGFRVKGVEKILRITGPHEKACNVPGQKPEVEITTVNEKFVPERLQLPPLSITLYVLR